jgi:ubiquinone/menaquinone biosynthesis C-methylase UbiE
MRPLTRRALPLFVTLFVPAAFVPAALFAQRSGSTIGDARILDALGAREGATICEIGAGSGDLSIAAARQVGSGGRVYTSELGDARVDTLKRHVADSKLPQISVVAGDATQTNFPDGACDAVFMRNVYHHFADPPAMNASIAAALKPGGRLVVVDFAPPGDEASQPADRDEDGKHGIKADTLARELREAGFQPVSSEQGSGRWYLIAVAKPASGSS